MTTKTKAPPAYTLAESAKAAGLDGEIEAFLLSRAQDFGIPLERIISKNRKRYLVRARHQIILELRDKGLSYPKIGKLLKRDHSTVFYAAQKLRIMRRGE